MLIDPPELVKSPATAAYSKIRGIRNQPEAKVLEFMQGLFRAAVEAKGVGNWSRSVVNVGTSTHLGCGPASDS